MKKKDISISICLLGLTDTENVMKGMKEFRPGTLSTIPISNPSETALNVIKGGAQRWKIVYYPYFDMFIFMHLYNMMPETVAALLRYVWS